MLWPVAASTTATSALPQAARAKNFHLASIYLASLQCLTGPDVGSSHRGVNHVGAASFLQERMSQGCVFPASNDQEIRHECDRLFEITGRRDRRSLDRQKPSGS